MVYLVRVVRVVRQWQNNFCLRVCVSYCLMIVQPLGGYDLQTSILWRHAMQPVDVVRIVCKQQTY